MSENATEAFVPPTLAGPYRVLLLGSATDAWYGASDADREERILPAFRRLVEGWLASGARVLATLDDDLFVAGYQGRPNWFLLFEVDGLETVVGMLQAIRETSQGVRMDEYVRFEARVGRPFFLLESGA